MPVLKPIPGHTSVKGARDYLIKDDRALAQDLLNMSWDDLSMDAEDESFKQSFDWAAEMDDTRASFGNDTGWRGLHARTYMHYVLSPDPQDNIDLPTLRTLAKEWTHDNFPKHEAAIVYHADNESQIPHAHIVVNNTDLETGYRLQVPKPRKLAASLQTIAAGHGLSFFTDKPKPLDSFAALTEKRHGPKTPPTTRQEVYRRRAESELEAKGQYSWVADIRNRVDIAKGLAASVAEFEQIADLLGLDIADNSPRAKRTDWVYSLQGHPTWKISGENLGLSYGKQALEAQLYRNSTQMNAQESKEILLSVMEYVELEDFEQLTQLARTVRTNTCFNVTCIDDYDRRIERLEQRLQEESKPYKQAKTQRSITALQAARELSSEKHLLPEHWADLPERDGSDEDYEDRRGKRHVTSRHTRRQERQRSSRNKGR